MEQYDRDGLLSNLRNYLENNGINTSRLFRCINPNHRDSNASMKYFNDGRCFCFGCGANYNLVDVIGIMENLDNKEAFKKAIQYYGRQGTRPQRKTKNDKVNETEVKNYEEKNYDKAYNACKLIAQMAVGKDELPKMKNPYTVYEPCCGSGVMCLAMLDTLQDKGVNYLKDVVVETSDIDKTCVYMTFLQLSFAGASGIIKQKDELTQEETFTLKTLGYYLQQEHYSRENKDFENE